MCATQAHKVSDRDASATAAHIDWLRSSFVATWTSPRSLGSKNNAAYHANTRDSCGREHHQVGQDQAKKEVAKEAVQR